MSASSLRIPVQIAVLSAFVTSPAAAQDRDPGVSSADRDLVSTVLRYMVGNDVQGIGRPLPHPIRIMHHYQKVCTSGRCMSRDRAGRLSDVTRQRLTAVAPVQFVDSEHGPWRGSSITFAEPIVQDGRATVVTRISWVEPGSTKRGAFVVLVVKLQRGLRGWSVEGTELLPIT